MDIERMMTVKVFSVPCFVWHIDFFIALANSFSSFVNIDANTASGDSFDFARFTMKLTSLSNYNKRFLLRLMGSLLCYIYVKILPISIVPRVYPKLKLLDWFLPNRKIYFTGGGIQ